MLRKLLSFLQKRTKVLLSVLSLFFSLFSFAQQKITANGKVITENNVPLAGVSVNVKGSSTGTITDANGKFTIQVNKGGTLILSFVDYQTREIVVNDNTDVASISMVPKNSSLGEVVVVGYGTQRKKDVTGAIASINMEDINIPSAPSFDEMLQGKIAGAQISQTSGGPGGGSINIIIRGISSITGGNEPLYVVDGFPINSGGGTDFSSFGGNLYSTNGIANNTQSRINPLSFLNPSDIVSIDILKDASATAIYGSRGANGVIMITTRRGVTGKAKISVGASYGLQTVAHKLHLLNSEGYAEYVAQGRDNAYVFGGGSLSDPESMRPVSQRVRPEFRDPKSIKTNTDWQDVIFRTAPVSNIQLSVNGGNERTKVYSSLNYMNQEGIILTTSYKRFTMRTNLDSKISDKIKIGSSITGSYGYGRFANVSDHYGNGGVLAQVLSASPTIPVYDSTGKPYFNQQDVTDAMGWLANPLDLLSGYSDNRTTSSVLWNSFVEYEIIKGLTLKSTIGIQYNDEGIKLWRSSKIPNYTNLNFPATAGASKITSLNWLNENTLNYSKTINDKNRLDALVGFTVQKDRNERLSAGATDFPTENITYLSAGTVNDGTHTLSEWSLVSFLGRINYVYDDKYLFTATLRRDGSSRFGINNKWGNFPSVALGYNIAKESYMKGLSFINDLKIRVSYGLSGNNQIGNYTYVGLLSPTEYVANDARIPGLVPSSLSNIDLGWEKSKQVNVGLDLGLFNNRIALTFNAYSERKTDLLLAVQLPGASGYNSATQNIGDIENKGIEIGLNTANISGHAFTWNSDFTFSANQNKVLKLATEGGRITMNSYQITEVGQPISSFYLIKQIGVFMNSRDLAGAALQNPRTQEGDIKFEDTNGDGKITTSDMQIVGNPWPDYTWGFSNNFSFKNFSLNISLVGTQGTKTFFVWGNGVLGSNGVQNQLADYSLNRWVSEDSPGAGFMPRSIRNNYAFGFSTNTSHYLFNSSFVRIKSANLSYAFPGTLISKMGLSALSMYLAASNLATFTKYPGYDPETSITGSNVAQSGIDYLSYPLARTITLGINLTF